MESRLKNKIMKRFYYITAAFAISLTLSGCGDGIDLPDLNVETDLNEIPLPDVLEGLEEIALKPETEPMKHAEQGYMHCIRKMISTGLE